MELKKISFYRRKITHPLENKKIATIKLNITDNYLRLIAMIFIFKSYFNNFFVIFRS